MTAKNFLVACDELHRTRWVDDAQAAQPLVDGQARLAITSFGLSANNITYAAFGRSMRYWDFFPSGDAAWGRIPVWGFGDVIESRAEGVAPGERFYGYYPMSQQLVVQPVRAGAAGFVDATDCRRELPSIYNHYSRCSADLLYQPEHEALIALLRPLFTTSFLLADFLTEQGFFGARTVVLSSASSKTAYGTAFCLRGNGTARVVGLTSPANLDFTRALGCYDDVRPYDVLDAVPGSEPAVYVDFSGSRALRVAVHTHFGDALKHSAAIGGTHWEDLGGADALPGLRPTLFFAPARAQQRSADWGADVLRQRLAEQWGTFIEALQAARPPWLVVTHGHGPAAVEAAYQRLVGGRMGPTEGPMLTLQPTGASA
jgi:hypothetical protein